MKKQITKNNPKGLRRVSILAIFSIAFTLLLFTKSAKAQCTLPTAWVGCSGAFDFKFIK